MEQERDEKQIVNNINETINDTIEQVGVAPIKQERTFLQRYGFPLVLLTVCLVLGGYLLYSQNKTTDNLQVQMAGVNFSYADTDGNEVTLENTNGKVRLLYFFFASCPNVCPPTTALLSQVQDELKADKVFGNKVEFMSVTIDPTKDTTDVLKDYADTYDADLTGWKFLRGQEQATAELAKKYQILVDKDDEGNFSHMNLIVLLDKKGNVRDWISANDYIEEGVNNKTPQDMAKEIKSLL
ncbi:SCO family protein [Cohnella yongneupensis]|uniref:SCO family protein n=1 Tax=Cohnella yongneupensis TaxID=425006 RepID=A0ABW0QZ63_9BACL